MGQIQIDYLQKMRELREGLKASLEATEAIIVLIEQAKQRPAAGTSGKRGPFAAFRSH